MTTSTTEDFIISVTAKDRPGIVAAVTRAVFGLGGNVTELSQTVMAGHFSLILRATCPTRLAPEAVQSAIEQSVPEFKLSACVRRYDPVPAFAAETDAPVYFLTVQGPDRPGLIAGIAAALAERRINIEDLYTRSEEEAITMILQVHPRDESAAEALRRDHTPIGAGLGVAVHLLHRDILRATSEVGAIRRLVRGGIRP
ncbi:MAG: ACT domain-containing protein [Methylothermaceae bacterium]|nr:ACT domain-containing protein [Methylothermaceae bacterium]